jgi:hypothetical protein
MKNKISILLFVLLAGITGWLFMNRKTSTITGDLRDFAVQDTASVDKIFLADRDGRTALLTRAGIDKWMVNQKYPARQDAVNNLLETVKLLEVRSPVGKNLYNNTMKLMAARSVKIEIYQKGQLAKTYYVGHPTMDNLGTFMYLEHSTVPYIMHIPGFNGFLSTRYFANENEWRDRIIFRFDPRTIVHIDVKNTTKADRNFTVTRNPDSTFAVAFTQPLKQIPNIDIMKMRKYLEVFSKTNFERVEANLRTAQMDSIMKTAPFSVVSVTDDRNYTKTIRLYRKPITASSRNQVDENTGKPLPFDMDRFYTRIDGDEVWYICQYFHFDRVLINPMNLMPGGNSKPTQDRY